jgi:hypothetical protein
MKMDRRHSDETKTLMKTAKAIFGIFATTLAIAIHAHSQTVISGPNISGTWSPSGNPYIVVSDCTVPNGQTLTIQPGVVVWIGQGVSINVNGAIQAVGNPVNRITFQPPISSQYWNTISINGANVINQFEYCDFQNGTNMLQFSYGFGIAHYTNQIMFCSFSNANTALIYKYGYPNRNDEITFSSFQNVGTGISSVDSNIKIMNCVFSNCQAQAINLVGATTYSFPVIKNCYFNAVGNGCVFTLDGYWLTPEVTGNIFYNVTNSAITMGQPDHILYSPSAQLTAINNTFANCGVGVSTTGSWDAIVQSSLFVWCSNAMFVNGPQSRNVSYNGFYGNAANFTGYPATYGQPIIVNRNGTPSDVLFNIFQDPKFVATNDFHLQTNSPAIDAGTPDWAWTDMCFPPSQGTSFPDLGAYGGPDACNWLTVVPILPTQPTITSSGQTAQINWGAIPRSEYLVQYLTNFATAGTNTWLNFTNGDVLATDKPTSFIVATNWNQPKMFFRIQSLGRPAGN